MNKRFLLSLFAILFLLSSCGGDKENSAHVYVSNQKALDVKTAIVSTLDIDNILTLSGKVEAKNHANVSARIMGYVTSLNIKVGDYVKNGQLLLKIENNELPAKAAQVQANIKEAKAAMYNVKVNYDRYKSLNDQNSITKREWDDISTQYEMAKARVNALEETKNEVKVIMGYTSVVSPINGVVASKNINLGDLVNPGVPLFIIESGSEFNVVFGVSESQIAGLKKGKELKILIRSLNKEVKGIINEIAPSATNSGGQYIFKAALQLSRQDRDQIKSGMYANVLIPGESSNTNAPVVVNKNALIERGQLVGIFTISNQNTSLLRWIRLGKDFGDKVEVVSGLSPGEEYIVEAQGKLIDGLKVNR